MRGLRGFPLAAPVPGTDVDLSAPIWAIEHVAAALHLSVDTAREYTYRAGFPAAKAGFARNLWLREEVLAWFAELPAAAGPSCVTTPLRTRTHVAMSTRTTRCPSIGHEGGKMSSMTGRQWAGWLCAAISGVLIAWVGGFLLSSGNSRCIDGPETSECSGLFASGAWHAIGLVSIIVGMILVIVAVAFARHTHRQARFAEL